MKFNEQHVAFVGMMVHSLCRQLSVDLGKDYKECLYFVNSVMWYCAEVELESLCKDRDAFDKLAAGFALHLESHGVEFMKEDPNE